MQHTKTGKALTEIIIATFRLNGAIMDAGDTLVKDLGLTSARWQVLSAVGDGAATVSEVARRMGLSRQNVQRITNRLVRDGFIELLENPAHRRAKICSLSEAGERTLAEVTRRQKAWANDMSKGMDPADLSRLVLLMGELRRKIETS